MLTTSLSLPPNNCSICYQMYNNERTPLILVVCGHTFCKECLDIIMSEDKEIICPECKQITIIMETPTKSLPKNRSLLDMIIYSTQNHNLNKDTFKANLEEDKKRKENENLLLRFEKVISNLEETYTKILDDHNYLNDISDLLITKEVDDVLDSVIILINKYRQKLHIKIQQEFEKVNLIKSFKSSLNTYKSNCMSFYQKLYKNNQNEINLNLNPNNNSNRNLGKFLIYIRK